MSIDLAKILESIRIPPVVAGSVAIFTALFLFLPQSILDVISVGSLREEYAVWVGAAFLFSVAVLIAHCFKPTASWLKLKSRYLKALRSGKKYLRSLTADEKKILRGYLENETRTRNLSMEDGVVTGLESSLVLYKATGLLRAGRDMTTDYNLHPWAWEYLREHPELIE